MAGVALAIVAFPTVREALAHIRQNPFNTNVLMTIAAVGAFGIGSYEEGAAVLLLFNAAEALEGKVVDKVRDVVRRFAGMLPKRALVRQGDALVETSVEEVKVGDEVLVKPGWRIPFDGRVLEGYSNVDQSTITGESVPVQKFPGSYVYSGTLNMTSPLTIRVERAFKDSTVNRILNLVLKARERKARIERFIERFSRFYTPSIMALAAAIAFIPSLLLGQPVSVWGYRALIVLVVACPSALAISSPVTMMFGLTRAMWASALVKGGVYLEELAGVRLVAFDKTGTLTYGRLKVTSVHAANGFSYEEVIKVAASVEALSTHPVAEAITRAAKDLAPEIIKPAIDVSEVPGKGIVGRMHDGSEVVVGRATFLRELGISVTDHEQDGGLHVSVAFKGVHVGTLCLNDEIRYDAKESVARIKSMGIGVAMLTGDNLERASSVAKDLGIGSFYASLLPEDKVKVVEELKKNYGKVAMIGDGVNDAPVLASSDVGIAVGTAGNDVAIESADIAIMVDDLRVIPRLIRLSKRVRFILKLNIAIALTLKLMLIVLAITGIIPLWVGVLGDDGVTLLIIANSLPILKTKLT